MSSAVYSTSAMSAASGRTSANNRNPRNLRTLRHNPPPKTIPPTRKISHPPFMYLILSHSIILLDNLCNIRNHNNNESASTAPNPAGNENTTYHHNLNIAPPSVSTGYGLVGNLKRRWSKWRGREQMDGVYPNTCI